MKTILLVDDNPHVLKLFGLALRREGYHVIEAGSGEAGLEMARENLPDLILTDVNMPGKDGSTLLRDIRQDPELRTRQVVLMTGRPDLVAPRKAMEDGADDFLLKPITFDSLRNCIEARFNRSAVSWRVENEKLAELRSSVPAHLPHEFFTPLAGIIGLVEILRSDFSGLAPAEVSEIHVDIHHSALRLHRTLRNYLMILDLQTAASQPESVPLSPREVRESVQAGVEEVLRQNQRRQDVVVQVDAACSLALHPGDLRRLVEELVDNACKFSRKGTPVRVELDAGGRLVISDEGRGLRPEEIGRIGAFQQFDRKTHEQQGLGLGLVLVQKLALRSGAKFSLHSRPGEGTRAQIAFVPATAG